MKAVVLCAGEGRRLWPLTASLPKAMLPFEQHPLLEHTLLHLSSFGFRDIAINISVKSASIADHFGDGSDLGIHLHYSREDPTLGTAGALKRLEPFLSDVPDFLVIYGDLITNQDLGALWRAHQGNGRPLATLVVHQTKGSNSLVTFDKDNRILQFLERPTRHAVGFLNPALHWANSGIQVLNNESLSLLRKDTYLDLPKDLYEPQAHLGRLFANPLKGYRRAIDSIERYEQAQADLADGQWIFARRDSSRLSS